MSQTPETIALMDEETAKSYFVDAYDDIETLRLMYPNEWREQLAGAILNKWIVCMEVRPKVEILIGEALWRKLALHAYDVLTFVQGFESQV